MSQTNELNNNNGSQMNTSSSESDPKNSDKARALGHIPSGLFIVASYHPIEKKADGFLASFIQQVSFSPLLISMAMKPGRPAYQLISESNLFTINIVGEHNRNYLKHFWSGYKPEVNPFAETDHEIIDNALYLKSAKSTLLCRKILQIKPGDHDIVFAEVLNGKIFERDAKPYIHLRKSGLDY